MFDNRKMVLGLTVYMEGALRAGVRGCVPSAGKGVEEFFGLRVRLILSRLKILNIL